MGAYLSQPITNKETADGENPLFHYGVASMQGWRMDMEDAHATVLSIDPDSDAGLFAVFDGHGGKEVAKYASKHVARLVVETEQYKAGHFGPALTSAFLAVDELLVLPEHKDELKTLRGEKGGKDSKPGGEVPMVINGSSLPDHILEALGISPDSGLSIRLVRNGTRGLTVEGLEGGEEEEEEEVFVELGSEEDCSDGEEEAEGSDAAGKRGSTAKDAKVKAKRKREGAAAAAALRRSGPQAIAEGGTAQAPCSSPTLADSPFEVAAAVPQLLARSVAEETRAAVAAAPVPEPDEEPDTPSDQGEGEYLGPTAGCTAVCALVRDGTLIVANAGDSRCVLSRAGAALAMTQDHKPDDPAEYSRIINAGGFVADGRVNGSLNLSRALGDMEYKQSKDLGPEHQTVTAVPEVRSVALRQGDEFLILACDGIWDVLTVQEAVDFARERLLAGQTPVQVCREMCDHCLAPDTDNCGKGCDNMSVIVVILKGYGFPEKLAAATGTSRPAA